MYKYENKEYLKNEIIGQSRHQFIYGYNNEERKSFIKELDNDFPIKIDSNLPMTIYLNEFGLPNIPINNSELDLNKIDILSREYLSFSIACSILLKSKENIGFDLTERIEKLLTIINKYYKNSNYPNILSLDDLINVLEQSKDFYKVYYIDYLKNGIEDKSINDIVLPFLQLESFVSQYKKVLNNTSYFSVIIDKCDDIAASSTKAINLLIGSRINKDISMKIVLEPNMWETYFDLNGQFVESIHDYGIVELDNSHREHVKKLKRI